MNAGSIMLSDEPEYRLRRALLRASRDGAILQDRIDCAELALSLGWREMAAMLYGLVSLQLGFSAAPMRCLHAIDVKAQLWGDLLPIGIESPQSFSVDLALDELKRLMRFVPELQSSSYHLELFSFHNLGFEDPNPEVFPAEIYNLGRSVGELLRTVPCGGTNWSLSSKLRGLAEQVSALSPIYLQDHAEADVHTLATLFALEGVRQFLLANADLRAAATAALFDEAAMLAPGALGPFFSNVHMLLRHARDIFGLIDAAAGGRAGRAAAECWSVLLASYLPPHNLASLATELGDRGMVEGLRRILIKVARAGSERQPLDVVYSIRDASLDIDAFALAADAQQLIAHWRRGHGLEWRLLSEMRAHEGDVPAAEAALQYALKADPHDRHAQDLLRLIASGVAGSYVDKSGGGRRNLRQARLRAFKQAGSSNSWHAAE